MSRKKVNKSKKKKLRGATLWIDIYETDIALYIGTRDEMLEWFDGIAPKELAEKIRRDVEDHGASEDVLATTYYPKGSGSLIWLPQPRVNELSHEVFHAVAHLLRHKGLPLTSESEEAYTYLYAYVFTNFHNFVMKEFGGYVE